MIIRTLVGGLTLSTLLASASLAQTTVRILTAENDPLLDTYWEGLIAAYEAENPDVDVVREYLSNMDIMAKMPTLLASDAAPDLIYSWGGGVLRELAATGQLRNIQPEIDADNGAWRTAYAPAALEAYTTADGAIWGVPLTMTLVPLVVNLDLLDQAGVDPASLGTWDGFKAAVEQLKSAGITPIALGAMDKWPVHFWWTYLALREAGAQAFTDAKAREGEGWLHPGFTRAGKRLIELAELEPFQPGFAAATWPDSLADFGSGRAAMILGFSWVPATASAADGASVTVERLQMLAFPTIDGGLGAPTETFAGTGGFMLFRDASDEAVDFIRWATNLENQAALAALNSPLPVSPGAAAAITDPGLRWAAEQIAASTYNQIFLDQDLGQDVGWGVVNEQSFELVTQNADPAEVAAMIQEAWLDAED